MEVPKARRHTACVTILSAVTVLSRDSSCPDGSLGHPVLECSPQITLVRSRKGISVTRCRRTTVQDRNSYAVTVRIRVSSLINKVALIRPRVRFRPGMLARVMMQRITSPLNADVQPDDRTCDRGQRFDLSSRFSRGTDGCFVRHDHQRDRVRSAGLSVDR